MKDICMGRKEIIDFFKEIKLISSGKTDKDAWRLILLFKRKYSMDRLICHYPNGKPYIIKQEVLNWLELQRKLEIKSLSQKH